MFGGTGRARRSRRELVRSIIKPVSVASAPRQQFVPAPLARLLIIEILEPRNLASAATTTDNQQRRLSEEAGCPLREVLAKTVFRGPDVAQRDRVVVVVIPEHISRINRQKIRVSSPKHPFS